MTGTLIAWAECPLATSIVVLAATLCWLCKGLNQIWANGSSRLRGNPIHKKKLCEEMDDGLEEYSCELIFVGSDGICPHRRSLWAGGCSGNWGDDPMKRETNTTPSTSPMPVMVSESVDWTEHEHVSEHVQLEAQKLVHLVGSSELARNAIDVAEQRLAAVSSDDPTLASPTAVTQADSFKKALEDFETSLERPLISGELADWVTAAIRTHQQLGVLLREDVQLAHANLYATILREDTDLSSRVAELRATDEQLLHIEFDKIALILSQLSDRAQSSAQDEEKPEILRVEVIRLALAFVIGARTQETAITTWFSEAFNRDCGSGD